MLGTESKSFEQSTTTICAGTRISILSMNDALAENLGYMFVIKRFFIWQLLQQNPHGHRILLEAASRGPDAVLDSAEHLLRRFRRVWLRIL